MPAFTKTRLIPNDRYVAITNAAPSYCILQAKQAGIRIVVAQSLPDRETRDFMYVSYSAMKELRLPALAAGDIVYARADRTPTSLTILSDQTIISGF